MSFRSQTRCARQNGEQGYALITLLLIFAIMGIMAATLVTSIKFDIQRDREEEMIHRGVQYSRAIRAFYRKFGRYPASIENLENTNQIRFLRKRYKDPLTGKDFKLLHFGEVKMGIYGMGGASVLPGASTVGPTGALTQNGLSNSSFGNNSTSGNSSSFGQAEKTATDSSQPADSGTDAGGSSTKISGEASNSNDQGSADQPVRTFGGMPIVGVASTSKGSTIREFEKKKKYNEWLFVYDPGVDRGFLITTPYQPQQQMFGVAQQNLNPQNPTPGLGTSAPGSGGNAPVPPPNNNTPGNPNQPTDTPNPQ